MSDFDEIKRITKVYDDRAKSANGLKAAGQWGSKELADLITKEIIRKIDLKKEDCVLEIGCGSGVLGSVVEKNCEIYSGFDVSKLMLKKFQTEYPLKHGHNLIEAFATQIPFKENLFDKIILNGVSMYFPNEKFLLQVLTEIKRVSKTESVIFIGENIVPTRYYWELVWYENLPSIIQIFARPYIKFRRWLAKKKSPLSGKWKNSHNDISSKFVQKFFKEDKKFFVSDSAAYTVRKKRYGNDVRGNRRMDFLIHLKK